MIVDKNAKKQYLYVYISTVTSSTAFSPIFPKERENEINSVRNERVKREKYSAWRLLEYAVSKALGISIVDAKLTKDENGKWHSPHFEFSISHSRSAVAVAISHAPVGIDVELVGSVRHDGFAERNLTSGELSEYYSLPDTEKEAFLLTRWCIKEAVFKKRGDKIFSPSNINTIAEGFTINSFRLNGENYVCAVTTQNPEQSPKITFVEQSNLYV